MGLEGNLVREFGRVGEGPGEFDGDAAPMLKLTILNDRRIAVFDAGMRAFALFGPDGDFERNVPFGGTFWVMIPGLQADPATESVISTGEVRHFGAPESPHRPIMRYVLSGDEVLHDTVAMGWKPLGDPEAFAPRLRAGVLPDGGVAFTDSSGYAIKITAPGRGVERILTRPLRPDPVTDGMKAAHIERELEALQTSVERASDPTERAMAEFRRGQLEAMEYYHEVPVVRSLRTSWQGTIWVRRRGDEPESIGPIDLITADGRYLGTFPRDATDLPAAIGPNGLVAFVEKNDLNVPTVVVKRLPRGVR